MIWRNFSVRLFPERRIKTTPEELAEAIFPVIAAVNDYFGTSMGWGRSFGKKVKFHDVKQPVDCLRFIKPRRNDVPGNIVPEWGYTLWLYFCPFASNRHIAKINILWGDYNDYLPMNRISIGLRGQKDRALIEKIQRQLLENFVPDAAKNEITEGYLEYGKDVPLHDDTREFFESLL